MKYISIKIPPELSNKREFKALIYSKSSNGNDFKKVSIELDENDKKIIDYSCTCKINTINESCGKKQIKCRHIKDFEEKIKSFGYLKEEEKYIISNNLN